MTSPQLSNYLRANRKRLALSQQEMAFLLGAQDGTKVCRYENFSRMPSLETALACEVIFQRPVSELFDACSSLNTDGEYFTNFAQVEKTVTISSEGTCGIRLIADDGMVKVTNTMTVNYFSDTNPHPSVSITSPANSNAYTAGVTIPVTAVASAWTGAIAKVEFFVSTGMGNALIGRTANTPYSLNWIAPPPGNYTLFAEATDQAGRVGRSAAVLVQVATNGNHFPVANKDVFSIFKYRDRTVVYPLENDTDYHQCWRNRDIDGVRRLRRLRRACVGQAEGFQDPVQKRRID